MEELSIIKFWLFLIFDSDRDSTQNSTRILLLWQTRKVKSIAVKTQDINRILKQIMF